MSEQDQVREHRFDGIQEYDNRLPNWWLWTFFGACIFSVAYWAHYHEIFETARRPSRRYERRLRNYEKRHRDRARQKPVTDESCSLSRRTRPRSPRARRSSKGRAPASRATRRARAAFGLGVNLTDDHWKHGPKPIQRCTTRSWDGVQGHGHDESCTRTLLGAARPHREGRRLPSSRPRSRTRTSRVVCPPRARPRPSGRRKATEWRLRFPRPRHLGHGRDAARQEHPPVSIRPARATLARGDFLPGMRIGLSDTGIGGAPHDDDGEPEAEEGQGRGVQTSTRSTRSIPTDRTTSSTLPTSRGAGRRARR
jgi:hypothetical protein